MLPQYINHKVFNVDFVKFKENKETFNSLSNGVKGNIILYLLVLNQLYINYSEIEDSEFKILEETNKIQ